MTVHPSFWRLARGGAISLALAYVEIGLWVLDLNNESMEWKKMGKQLLPF